METPNYRKASIYFDDETVLEVTQRGGGGSGVGGETGLEAVNLITGESTNDALAEKDETIEAQAATIESQAGTIEEQEATIETQAATIIEKDETITSQAATITEQAGTIEELETELANSYQESKQVSVTLRNNSGSDVDFLRSSISPYGASLGVTHLANGNLSTFSWYFVIKGSGQLSPVIICPDATKQLSIVSQTASAFTVTSVHIGGGVYYPAISCNNTNFDAGYSLTISAE